MEREIIHESAATEEVEREESEDSEEHECKVGAEGCGCPTPETTQYSYCPNKSSLRLAVSDYMLAMAVGALLPEVIDLFFYLLK